MIDFKHEKNVRNCEMIMEKFIAFNENYLLSEVIMCLGMW